MRVANKVAINTVIQYTRLLLNFVISLYSVRVILNALGASDYGIYDVIAGVIAILGFLLLSLSFNFATGIPVQREMILAISSSVTLS